MNKERSATIKAAAICLKAQNSEHWKDCIRQNDITYIPVSNANKAFIDALEKSLQKLLDNHNDKLLKLQMELNDKDRIIKNLVNQKR